MFLGLTFPPGYEPQITLTGRTSGAVYGPYTGAPSGSTEYVFDLGDYIADGDYNVAIESPAGACCLRVTNGVPRVESEWNDFNDPPPPPPPTPPTVDPSTRPLSKSVDGQSITQHNLKDVIAWEQYQSLKQSGGGWAAVGLGQVRLGGPAENGPIRK